MTSHHVQSGFCGLHPYRTVIFAGVYTLLQTVFGLFWNITSALLISCTVEVSETQPLDTGISRYGWLVYYYNMYDLSRCNGDLEEHSEYKHELTTPASLYRWIGGSIVINFMWTAAAIAVIYGATKERYSLFIPWLVLLPIIIIFDAVVTVAFSLDLTKPVREYNDHIGTEKENYYQEILSAFLLLPLLFSRALIFWILNLALFSRILLIFREMQLGRTLIRTKEESIKITDREVLIRPAIKPQQAWNIEQTFRNMQDAQHNNGYDEAGDLLQEDEDLDVNRRHLSLIPNQPITAQSAGARISPTTTGSGPLYNVSRDDDADFTTMGESGSGQREEVEYYAVGEKGNKSINPMFYKSQEFNDYNFNPRNIIRSSK